MLNNIYIRPFLYILPVLALVGSVWIYFSRDSDVESASQTTAFDSSHLKIESFVDLDGKNQTVKSDNRVVIIHFWASWCGPCVEEFPQLIELVSSRKGDTVVYAISGDTSKDEIDIFLKSFPAALSSKDFHIVWDSEKKYIQDWQVNKLPESYIYDSKRNLVKRISGAVDWSSADAKEFIQSIANK